MESNRNITKEPNRTTGSSSSTGSGSTASSSGATGQQSNTPVASAPQRAKETAQATIDQTKQVVRGLEQHV